MYVYACLNKQDLAFNKDYGLCWNTYLTNSKQQFDLQNNLKRLMYEQISVTKCSFIL